MSQFHLKHGRAVTIGEDGRSAWKNNKFGSCWLYSKRDVKENEIVCLRVAELSKHLSKKPLIVSVTDEDPIDMPLRRPKTAYHLCNRALPLPIQEIQEGTMIILTYDSKERLLYLGIDGVLRGVTSLYGLRNAERWLAVKLAGNVQKIQIQESPENQWRSFVLETTRISQIFKDIRFFNCGATGLQQPLLSFHPVTNEPRVKLSDDLRCATVQSVAKEDVTLFTARPVLLNEIVSLSLTRVCYGTTIEVFATPQNPESYDYNINPNFSLKVDVSQDELLRLVCTEKGVLVQGIGNFVQSSTRFHPFGPVWLVFRIRTPASFMNIEFEDPHHLPASSSLRENRMVVRNRAYSKQEDENTVLCKICFKVKMDTCLSPCYHLSMCSECTRKVMEKTKWRCPVCMERIDGFFKVHVV